MSDIVSVFDLQKVQKDIQVVDANQCLNYAGKQRVSSEPVVFIISVPYSCLRYLYNCKAEDGLLSQVGYSYIEILNFYLDQISG